MIIGCLGTAGSGKDEVANIIKSFMGSKAETIGLADRVKTISCSMFDLSHEQCYGSLKDLPDERYVDPNGGFLTPRKIFQFVATEVARTLYPDIWINYGMRRMYELLAGEVVKCGKDHFLPTSLSFEDKPEVVVCSDVRFVNEARAISNCEIGTVWQIVRPNSYQRLTNKDKNHVSETEQKNPEINKYVDIVIHNDGTIEDLKLKVKLILSSMGVYKNENVRDKRAHKNSISREQQ